jgi:uncharacterized protein YukE
MVDIFKNFTNETKLAQNVPNEEKRRRRQEALENSWSGQAIGAFCSWWLNVKLWAQKYPSRVHNERPVER